MDILSPFEARSGLETISVVFTMCWLTFASANLSSVYFGNKPITNFLLEFLITITTVIFLTTLLESKILAVNLLVATLSCVVICLIDRRKCCAVGTQKTKTKDLRKPFITNSRANLNVLTAICILAVDFKVFPNRFMKTEKYGLSLMDAGVGLFVYINGIVAPEIRGNKNSIYKTFLQVLIPLVLGIARFVMTTMIQYHVHVSEYGVHWNFFITLAVTKLLSAAIMAPFECNFVVTMWLGVFVLTVHQVLLNYGVEAYVLSNAARNNFIDANREGLVSCFGYVGLYFLAVSFGFIIHSQNKLYKQLIITNLLLILTTALLHCKFDISRCVANSTYCVWISFVGGFTISFFYFVEQFMVHFYMNLRVTYVPFIYDAINYNGLLFFLTANLLTGFVNIVFDTKKLKSPYVILILIIYMMVTSLIVCFFYVKKIRLKL